MEKVLGIGGFFFRALDPKGLARWYADCLGVDLVQQDYGVLGWHQQAGTTVFSPFKQDSPYFGNTEKVWMLNFRVRDMDSMVRQLRAKDVVVDVDPQVHPSGIYASFVDPEGNPVTIWESQAVDARE